MRATVSLMGLFNYSPSLFEGFNYPEKWNTEEQQTFIDKLLFDTAELEILYPDPTVLNSAMRVWSRAMKPNWDKLYETTHFDYNPIWNKDGVVSESETIKRNNAYKDQRDGTGSDTQHSKENATSTEDVTGNQTETNTQTNNLAQGTTSNTHTTTSTNTNTDTDQTVKDYVFGFNDTDKAQSEQHETDGSETVNGNGSEDVSMTGSQTNTGTVKTDDTISNTGKTTNVNVSESESTGNSTNSETLDHSGSDDENREYTRKEQGNIGITTTQQMIREEREVDKFNLMDYIIDSFMQRFCLMVY